MKIWFLSAAVSVTKTFTLLADGSLEKDGYPLVRDFTSHETEVQDISSFLEAIETHAFFGHTLIKGRLNKPLVNTSRAGATTAQDRTQWLCLDFDGLGDYSGVDEVLEEIGLGDTSYILQHSASSGMGPGLRCHVFMILFKEIYPSDLKKALKYYNLTVSNIERQLELTASMQSIKWPIDITSCQNDKLIYIAPPRFLGEGLKDPVAQRIELVIKQYPTLSINKLPVCDDATLDNLFMAKLRQLRASHHLPVKDKNVLLKRDTKSGIMYAPSPQKLHVTGKKIERGFVYLNLNGGDSWGYYYPENNPTILFNFKGEPNYRLDEALPSLWEEIQHAQGIAADSNGLVHLPFVDTGSDTARVRGMILDAAAGKIRFIGFGSKKDAFDWAFEKGHRGQAKVEHYDVVFDPNTPLGPNKEARVINCYKRSPLSLTPDTKPVGPGVLTQQLINHVFSNDMAMVDHFHNWMACVLQFREPTGTAWVISGIQGVGKGTLTVLIKHCIGEDNFESVLTDLLGEIYSGQLEYKLMVNIDEVQASSSVHHKRIMQKLKHHITEKVVSYRRMYMEGKKNKNYNNFILTSNMHDPVEVAENDRRFNVTEYQSVTTQLSMDEHRRLEAGEESAQLYWYWMNYPADSFRARTVLNTPAKQQMQKVSGSASAAVATALRNGSLEWFAEQLPDDLRAAAAMKANFTIDLLRQEYVKLVADMIRNLKTKLTKDDLKVIIQYCLGPKGGTGPVVVTQHLGHHGINTDKVLNMGGMRRQRGYEVSKWVFDPQWRADMIVELDTAGVP